MGAARLRGVFQTFFLLFWFVSHVRGAVWLWQRMFYSTSVFGPLDWRVLGPRFRSAAGVQVRICDAAGACSVNVCIRMRFGNKTNLITRGSKVNSALQ